MYVCVSKRQYQTPIFANSTTEYVDGDGDVHTMPCMECVGHSVTVEMVFEKLQLKVPEVHLETTELDEFEF